jgi:hypothetical protein
VGFVERSPKLRRAGCDTPDQRCADHDPHAAIVVSVTAEFHGKQGYYPTGSKRGKINVPRPTRQAKLLSE